MQLILLRHGIAVDRSEGLADGERPLTEVGVDKTRRAVKGLGKLIGVPDVIVASPKRRARQTAEIVADLIGGPLELDSTLADGSPHAMIEALGRRDGTLVVAVGHEPSFSEMVELLCFGKSTSSVELKKAGCACVAAAGRLQPGNGMLQWLATPTMLRKLDG